MHNFGLYALESLAQVEEKKGRIIFMKHNIL